MPLSLYRRGKVWHYRGTVGPPGARRKLRGTCRTEVKAEAEAFITAKEAREWKRGVYGPEAVTTFAQAAIIYRASGKPTRFLDRVEDYWRDTPIREITPGQIRQAAISLYQQCSAATRNRQVIVPTVAIINHAAEAELCQKITVKRFPVETKVKKPVTWAWVTEFMSSSSAHLGALACFMFLTGARISEALSLRWTDVDFSTHSALIRQTKIGAERRAHLPPSLIITLANIPWREGKVFRYTHRHTVDKSWRNACRRAGIEMLSPHCCRHGFATAALQAGIDVVTVAKLGGWKSPQHVFQTYGHAMDDPTLTDRLVMTRKDEIDEHQIFLRSVQGGTKSG